MNKLLTIAKTFAYLGIFLMTLIISVLAIEVRHAVIAESGQVKATITKVNNEIDEVHRLTLESALTVMEARKASVKESAYLDTWNKQLDVTFNNTRLLIDSLQSTSEVTSDSETLIAQSAAATLKSTQATIEQLQPTIVQATNTLVSAQKSISDLDQLALDPSLKESMTNISSTTKHLDATSADIQSEVHSITHPSWAVRVYHVGLDIGRMLNPF